MPPDGVRLHHDVIFALDEDTIENRMFARPSISRIIISYYFVSSLFINGDTK